MYSSNYIFEIPELNKLIYKTKDTINDGYLDTISFDLKSTKLPPEGTIIEATVEYMQDQRETLKKRIMVVIGLSTTILLLMNFILSFVFLGSPAIPFF